jgi:hypothetical protein
MKVNFYELQKKKIHLKMGQEGERKVLGPCKFQKKLAKPMNNKSVHCPGPVDFTRRIQF